VGCLYLPNGNPAPGPKFDYKLHWFERLQHASRLLASGAPIVLAGDYNVMPTEIDYSRPQNRRAVLQALPAASLNRELCQILYFFSTGSALRRPHNHQLRTAIVTASWRGCEGRCKHK
jgi:exonuclease III